MFVPPFQIPDITETKEHQKLFESKDVEAIKKYTEKYHNNSDLGLEIKEVPFEESVMGKLHQELISQKEDFRNYAAKQEINRDLDKKQAKRDAPKKFLRDCTIAIISGVIGSVIATIYINSGFSITEFFENIFH